MENGRLATSLAKAALVDAKGTRWQDATRPTVDYIHSLDMRIGNTLDLGYAPKDPKEASAEELDGFQSKWMAAAKTLEEHIEDMQRASAQFREIVKKVGST